MVTAADICHDTVQFVGLANFDHHVQNVNCYDGNDGVISLEQLDNSISIYSFT